MKIKGPVYILGDTHDVAATEKALMYADLTNCTVIHVGDAGITNRFITHRAKYLDEFLKVRNIRLKIVRGNHDCPEHFPHRFSDHLDLLDDYAHLDIVDASASLLCVGGSVSIDRCLRVDGADYWQGEPTRPIPDDLSDSYDMIIAHDCPSWINKSTQSLKSSFPKFCTVDPTILDDCNKQRCLMDEIFAKVKPSQWYYGHYHNDMYEVDRDCHFKCLNMNVVHRLKPSRGVGDINS